MSYEAPGSSNTIATTQNKKRSTENTLVGSKSQLIEKSETDMSKNSSKTLCRGQAQPKIFTFTPIARILIWSS